MRENIIDFLTKGDGKYKTKKYVVKTFIEFQMFYPIPILFGLFVGKGLIRYCMSALAVFCVTVIVMGIVMRNINKLNDVFHYNFLNWLQIGICFIGFSFILFYIRFNNILIGTIIVAAIIIFCVCHYIITLFSIEKSKSVKKQRTVETVVLGSGVLGAVLGRGIIGCVSSHISQNQAIELAAILGCIIGITGCVFATDELSKIYLIHKYNIDIYTEAKIQPEEQATIKEKIKLIFLIVGIVIYIVFAAMICFGVSRAMLEQ